MVNFFIYKPCAKIFAWLKERQSRIVLGKAIYLRFHPLVVRYQAQVLDMIWIINQRSLQHKPHTKHLSLHLELVLPMRLVIFQSFLAQT